DLGAVRLGGGLPHGKGDACVVLAAGAVAALPDAAEGIPHMDAPAVPAAGQVPGLHGGGGGPEGGAARLAPELPHQQGALGAVGHGVVFVDVGIGEHPVLVVVV